MTITYSRGSDKYDNAPVLHTAPSFKAFRDAVLSDRGKTKGQQYIAAPFKVGSHPSKPQKFPGEKGWRVAQYVQPRCWFPLDMDGCPSADAFEALKEECNGGSCFIYTTGNHTEESPRARLIFELTRPVDREEGIILGKVFEARIAEHLSEHDFVFDANVYRGEQPIYLPLQDTETFVFDGQLVDVDIYLKAYQGDTTAVKGSDDFELVEVESDKTDAEVIARIKRMTKYRALWDAQWEDEYPTQSHADFALMGQLCNATRSNAHVRRLFRQSGLGRRKKAQREDYLNMMLRKIRTREAELNSVDLDMLKATFPGMRPSFKSMLAQTDGLAGLDKVDQVEAVEKLVADAAHLSRTETDVLYKTIKEYTGFSLGVLRGLEKDNREKQEPVPDDGTLARQLVEVIGGENILAVESSVWKWGERGVWKVLSSRDVKQRVQRFISGKVKSITKNRVESVVDLFKSEVFRPEQQFNIGPPECVNVLNGELILDDVVLGWCLHPHKREHYRTTQIPVNWDPNATAPRFTQFLTQIFQGDPDAEDKVWALLEMMGYTLMAHCRYEKFVMLVGTGANGKSVLLFVLEQLCGRDSVAGVQPSEFSNKFQRAHLQGKLANIVSELRQGVVIDDEALKAITSGELTTVENKFGDPFSMRPFSTCWFGTNHLPHTRDFSDALFRRVLVVPFNRQFKPEKGNCDPALKDKLVSELPGVLRMVLHAYQRALVKGFTMPASSEAVAKKWRLEADQVAQFVDDMCADDPNGKEKVMHLYGAYKRWAETHGIKNTVGSKTFGDRLEQRGYTRQRGGSGNVHAGLRLNLRVEP